MQESPTTPAIELDNLTKKYGDFTALSGVSLRVRQGEVFGFLGPNGAGKTTTIRILMGILLNDGGAATILGWDCEKEKVEVKRRTGYLPDQPEFYDYLTGEELLRFAASMHGLTECERRKRIPALLGQFDLEKVAGEFAVNYSAGMKQKIALALAQVHDPEVYLLDEPTASLDPSAADDVRSWIRRTAREGKSVFLSTHRMAFAEELCDRVGILHRGRLQCVGKPEHLITRHAEGGGLEEVFFAVTRSGDTET